MTNFLRTQKLSVDEIVRELFDFSKLGAVSIPDIITEEAREMLKGSFRLAQDLFEDAQREEGQVIQEMKILYIESLPDPSKLPPELRLALEGLQEEYSDFYRRLSERAGFTSDKFNSIGIHFYPRGSSGITPHRDYARDVNLIANFIIQGNTPFFACKNRSKDGSVELDSTPGSLILMRAPRSKEELEYRPFHYVLPVKEDRYTVLIRNRTNLKK